MKMTGLNCARYVVIVLTGIVLLTGGCKKKEIDEAVPDDDTTATVTGSRTELSADSIFLYAKEIYLWNESLPSYDVFNPRQYVRSDAESGFNQELFDITRYAVNPNTGLSYEYYPGYPDETKYSYIYNTTNANPVAFAVPAESSVDLDGNGYDIGLRVGFYGYADSDAYDIYVQAVYTGSPAEKAGMGRGDLITSINGRSVGASFNSDRGFLTNIFYGTTSPVTLNGTKRDGSALNVTLNIASYRSSPVYCDTVYTSGSKKIGYLVYGSFTTLSNSQTVLDNAFSRFSSEGVTDLIVDLRYNGGGYVSTAEYLTNLIAPASLNGLVMYTEYFNSQMQQGKATILANQPLLDDNDNIQYIGGRIKTYADVSYTVAANTYKFAKKGSLGTVNNVVFLVTSNTASASELVINALKPYVNVKLVGDTTYGKPVGFFPVRIDKYDVYFSLFESKNSNNEGGYYDGFAPDSRTYDYPLYAFGDLRESSLGTAYSYIVNGSFSAATSKTASASASKGARMQVLQEAKGKLSPGGFKGMIEDRIRNR